MSPLDTALVRAQGDFKNQDDEDQAFFDFYQLFFSTNLFVPTTEPVDENEEDFNISPIILEENGSEYIMIFDSAERLEAWADGADMHYFELSGADVFMVFGAERSLILNANSDHWKEFTSEEITFFMTMLTSEIDDEQ